MFLVGWDLLSRSGDHCYYCLDGIYCHSQVTTTILVLMVFIVTLR